MSELELKCYAANIMWKLIALEKATEEMTMALGDEEPEWWNECLGEIDDGLTAGRSILCKRFPELKNDYMLAKVFGVED